MAELLDCEFTGDETEEGRKAKIGALFGNPDIRRAIGGWRKTSEMLSRKSSPLPEFMAEWDKEAVEASGLCGEVYQRAFWKLEETFPERMKEAQA